MPKTFNGSIKFTSNFDVQTTRPLDNRLVVDSKADLTNGSIEAPYQGMVVNIKGTSELWILKTSGIANSLIEENWELVTGSGSGEGSGLSKYSLPVMTPEMAAAATADSDIDFDGSEDPYIEIDDTAVSQTEMIYDLFGAIRALQNEVKRLRGIEAEVVKLRNTFEYGFDSYQDLDTAKGRILGELDVEESEPLSWALDPGYLAMVPDNVNFITLLDKNNTFVRHGECTIDISTEGQLTFNNGSATFSDGNAQGEELTLYKLTDSKLITYLVTDKPDVTLTLWSLDDKNVTREINLAPLMRGNTVNKYGFCIIISRKDAEEDKGFNYIYVSIINYANDDKIYEGYLTTENALVDSRPDENIPRYSIKSINFDRLTLYRMKFYTKFEDFSEGVITSAPSEDDYKYEVAHITIRSVKDKATLDKVADHLKDNELVWNKASGNLYIKSDGKIHLIGSNAVNPDDDNNNDDTMTNEEIIRALQDMGIVINVTYKKDAQGNDTDEIESVSNISMSPISDVTFINEDTQKRFTFTVDTEGNLVSKDNSAETIEEFLTRTNTGTTVFDPTDDYKAVRGFSSDYLFRVNGVTDRTKSVLLQSDTYQNSDRLRISSFYAPISTDDVHGCTHSYIELENTSNVDIPLTGVYLHFYNPVDTYNATTETYTGKVYHLELDGVIPAGGTYLVRGAKHAEFEDASAFIKVKTYDKEWYYNGSPVSFEQMPAAQMPVETDNYKRQAYRFCLTYGLPELEANTRLVQVVSSDTTINNKSYSKSDYPNIIINPRFIDSCSFSTDASVSKKIDNNPWYANGGGVGITIKKNTLFRLTFALDPAKQAYNGFNGKDSSRTRYNKGSDIQILDLSKEFIGFPHSNEIIKIDRYTPKASFEHKNVMTDKSQLNKEKPNMVTCSFGVDVYNTRCFNWISCGTFDEYVWVRKHGDTDWVGFESYKKVSADTTEKSDAIHRKEYSALVNNTVYARIINRFPGNDVLFTSHKCVLVLPEVDDNEAPVVYEYVVGRPDKDGNPDFEHTNDIYTFTLYPRSYEGRVYQVTDQQGFHWIEYQVWAAAAEYLNTKIDEEVAAWNSTHTLKVFPILLNTGDMTQSGARINEWLDYYNGGVSLFNHLEQMNCVGNNDLCPIDPRNLGTGDDSDKSSSHFFHYFYCFDVKDTAKYNSSSVAAEDKKFFSGETLVVKAHTGMAEDIDINVTENKYIPSLYYFKTTNAMYVVVNSEIPMSNVQGWFGLCSSNNQFVNIYTGIEATATGVYAGGQDYFTPIYDTLYAWLKSNVSTSTGKPIKKVIVAMHEMPFTVITNTSLLISKTTQLPCTRNHPTNAGRLGSNVNQLIKAETKGLCWCSRLLESFNCKLVVGGHKHTYALSYPIKEKYFWKDNQEAEPEWKTSEENGKPMSSTLADEADGGRYEISWDIDLSNDGSSYGITGVTGTLNSTKTPYIPNTLYNKYGKDVAISGLFRCCTPTNKFNSNYDGYVSYSMCQATGYKLKSNKELPSATQVFSKIIPQTINSKADASGTDSPSGNQLYPMYAVLAFNNNCTELDVNMNRITGIFVADGTHDNVTGADTFNQTQYGKGRPLTTQRLCTYESADCDYSGTTEQRQEATGIAIGETYFDTTEDRIYKCSSILDDKPQWTIVKERMYGKWLNEDVADARSDNKYLHIVF